MVRRDGTKAGLNAGHMMLRVPTVYIWPCSTLRFDSHAQLTNICAALDHFGSSGHEGQEYYYFCKKKKKKDNPGVVLFLTVLLLFDSK